ncbi:uncharacterized protein C8Q71DRAFT_765898 [Rhodofomes roseus]|uniref:BTB domain-containing protein n=1 Tax=Rhodofomes roseus TaxID=34475 RepID=A0ABQ8KCW2_9APHY|nr:uncharacterized protein C8Q71DRAFT_765898 [Rhodofomes roseus]KAH9835441.1 hypothetical protein C8Q71DRAFT_765898 [Rhodofomes roseus]
MSLQTVARGSGTNARKRLRSNSSNRAELVDLTATEIRPDNSLWFPDGNVTIIAADSVGFRVYGGLLARHSEVFRARIFGPATAADASALDSRSDVRDEVFSLDQWPSDAVRLLLRIVVLGESWPAVLPFAMVAALVRLSHEYWIKDVLKEGLARIRSCFSDTFDVWDEAIKKMRSRTMTFVVTDAIAAVNIARLTGEHRILPVALYMCCQLDPDDLLRGLGAECDKDYLSRADIMRCLHAQKELCRRNIDVAMAIWEISNDSEGWHEPCLTNLNAIAASYCIYQKIGVSPHDALRDWDSIIKEVTGGCCTHCIARLKQKAVRARWYVWGRLPEIVDCGTAWNMMTQTAMIHSRPA